MSISTNSSAYDASAGVELSFDGGSTWITVIPRTYSSENYAFNNGGGAIGHNSYVYEIAEAYKDLICTHVRMTYYCFSAYGTLTDWFIYTNE